MNNNVNNNVPAITQHNSSLPSKAYPRIINSLYEDPDEIMSCTANRLKIYSHFIHFVEEGGMPKDFVDPVHYSIHWGIIAKYMQRYVDEMNVHHAYSAIAIGRNKARETILQCVRGTIPRANASVMTLFAKLYFPEKDKKAQKTSSSRQNKLSLIDHQILQYQREREGREDFEEDVKTTKKRQAVMEFINYVDNMP